MILLRRTAGYKYSQYFLHIIFLFVYYITYITEFARTLVLHSDVRPARVPKITTCVGRALQKITTVRAHMRESQTYVFLSVQQKLLFSSHNLLRSVTPLKLYFSFFTLFTDEWEVI